MGGNDSAAVLIVDDNAANRAVYERVILDVPGAVPTYFADPEAALEWAREHLPTLVVVDYKMPKIDGLTFIQRIRSIPGRNSVPIVMLTGVEDERVIAEASRLGVKEFMKKPVDRRRLQGHIAHAVRMHEARRGSK